MEDKTTLYHYNTITCIGCLYKVKVSIGSILVLDQHKILQYLTSELNFLHHLLLTQLEDLPKFNVLTLLNYKKKNYRYIGFIWCWLMKRVKTLTKMQL